MLPHRSKKSTSPDALCAANDPPPRTTPAGRTSAPHSAIQGGALVGLSPCHAMVVARCEGQCALTAIR